MPNTINIVQPKAEDGVTEVSFVTRTNSIFKSDGSPLGDSLDAYMDEVDELSQNLSELFQSYVTTKTADANGRIFDTSFSTINKHIVCAECTAQGSIALPFSLDTNTLGVKCLAGSNMTPLSGSLTVKVWYFIKS